MNKEQKISRKSQLAAVNSALKDLHGITFWAQMGLASTCRICRTLDAKFTIEFTGGSNAKESEVKVIFANKYNTVAMITDINEASQCFKRWAGVAVRKEMAILTSEISGVPIVPVFDTDVVEVLAYVKACDVADLVACGIIKELFGKIEPDQAAFYLSHKLHTPSLLAKNFV